jgi:hypothetical protein
VTNCSRSLVALTAAVALLISAACGGESSLSKPPSQPTINVSISPATLDLTARSSATFSAIVTNSTNQTVTWKTEEGDSAGTITSTGEYTAPGAAGTYHVVATSQADPRKSARATVAVHIPPMVFSSTPSRDASEGTVYSYMVSAMDPMGEELVYELTESPAGATLTEATLTWTPTYEQSRIENRFSIVARTSSGRSTTQSWTVVPRGTIHGMMFYRYLTATGVETEPIDFGIARCSIFFRSQTGALIQRDSLGRADGTFSVSDVPGGYYWLVLWSWSPGWSWDPIWTNTRSIDLSVVSLGRRDAVRDGSRSRHFEITGLNPWQPNDQIAFSAPNAHEQTAWGQLDTGATVFSHINPAPFKLDAAKGDRAYLLQLISSNSQGYDYGSVAKALGPLEITDTDTEATPISGMFVDVQRTGTLRANVAISKFRDLISEGNPGVLPGAAYLRVAVHPFGTNEGVSLAYGETSWLVWANLYLAPHIPQTTDVDLGDISYGNPFPSSWPEFVKYEHYYGSSYFLPGTTYGSGLGGGVLQIGGPFPSAEKPLEPMLNAISNITIDGHDLSGPSTVSESPTLTWDLPGSNRPNGYRLTLYEITADGDTTRLSWRQGS